MSAYAEGLSGAQASWANKKYHGHCTLPPEMVAEIKKISSYIIYRLDTYF
jgi:hypothetical protein